MSVKTSFSNLCNALKTLLSNKVDNTNTGADSLLSKLPTTFSDIPSDNTFFIRQDVYNRQLFGRVKFSTLWEYIKSKADTRYAMKNRDTGWITTGNLKYRKSGYIVALQGSVTPSGSTMSITLGTLPEDCRPSQDINIAQAEPDAPSRYIAVHTGGDVELIFTSNCTASYTYSYNGIFMI